MATPGEIQMMINDDRERNTSNDEEMMFPVEGK